MKGIFGGGEWVGTLAFEFDEGQFTSGLVMTNIQDEGLNSFLGDIQDIPAKINVEGIVTDSTGTYNVKFDANIGISKPGSWGFEPVLNDISPLTGPGSVELTVTNAGAWEVNVTVGVDGLKPGF